jgi:hypothetical protein
VEIPGQSGSASEPDSGQNDPVLYISDSCKSMKNDHLNSIRADSWATTIQMANYFEKIVNFPLAHCCQEEYISHHRKQVLSIFSPNEQKNGWSDL